MIVNLKYNHDRSEAWLSLGDPVQVKVPTEHDRSPADWWNIEAITGIHSSRIVDSWGEDEFGQTVNRPLEDLREMLETELANCENDAFTTIEDLRRNVVKQRFMRFPNDPILPVLFIGRNDKMIRRVKALMEDVLGQYLFTTIGRNQDIPFIPTFVRIARDRLITTRLDNRDAVTGLLIRYIRFAKPGKTKPSKSKKNGLPNTAPPISANPPPVVVNDMFTFAPEWPELLGIARIPSMSKDGTIRLTPGYDAETSMWYAPDPEFRSLVIPEHPSTEELTAARDLILYPFAEFPFVDGPGGAIATIFEQVMLPIVGKYNRPLYAFEAPRGNQGTGKSLLAQALGSIIIGHPPTLESKGAGQTDEELEKRVTSFLRQNEQWHILDNLTDFVHSNILSILATSSGSIRGRILGTSDSPVMENRATWIMTLNGATFSRDLTRRVVLVRLKVTSGEGVFKRKFNLALPDWTIAHRPALIGALLTIVRGWVQAGRPTSNKLDGTRGGFEKWLATVGAVTAWAGFEGLPEALAAAEGREVESTDDAAFLNYMRDNQAERWLRAVDIVRLVEELGLYQSVLEKTHPNWKARKFTNEVLDRMCEKSHLIYRGNTSFAYYTVNVGTNDEAIRGSYSSEQPIL